MRNVKGKVFAAAAAMVLTGALCPAMALAASDDGQALVAAESGALSAVQMQAASDGSALQYATPTSNAWLHNYISFERWAMPTTSFLHVNEGTVERVEYSNGNLFVEQVADDYAGITSKRMINPLTYWPSGVASSDACLWGGFFSGSDANYVVTGQTNDAESNDVAVFRVTKYAKDWTFVSAAEVKGGNTTVPFEAGSCDMTELDGMLYVRTCHQMYTSSDGYRHQANVQLIIDESTMQIANQYTGISSQASSWGYVSHSFNQYITTSKGKVYATDHGDAYPRAITVKQFQGKYTYYLSYEGGIGNNTTGATLGGFTSAGFGNNLLAVGSVVSGTYNSSSPRNVWIGVAPGDMSTNGRDELTLYTPDDTEGADNPFIVKIHEGRLLVLWGIVDQKGKHTGEIEYVFVDPDGQSFGDPVRVSGVLSDCQPILVGENVVWYAGEGGVPTYYLFNTQTEALTKVTGPAEMYRLYNPNSGEHFYTGNVDERNHLVDVGWNYEKVGWIAPGAGAPVYRLYNPNNGGDHHYTKDAAERQMLIGVGWIDEGIGWYSADESGVAVYREYNPNELARNHNYTAEKDEHDYLCSIGWNDEGIAWYGV